MTYSILFPKNALHYTSYSIFLSEPVKKIYWVGPTEKDFLKFPDKLIDEFLISLRLAQEGEKAANAKPLKGFGGATVLELVGSDASGTYRAVYTVKMADFVFVLHVFQKKSKQGIATPQKEIDLIKSRLKWAQEIYKGKGKINEKK